jgi:hypothetical protein
MGNTSCKDDILAYALCILILFAIALLGNNDSLQIIETWFAEKFYASHRMGPAPICLKISARIA